MLVDIIMPKLGESIVEGTVLAWRKAVGDSVVKDEVLLEVSTDKVDSEIPALEGGVLAEVLVLAGTRVDVGAVLGRLRVSGQSDVSIPVEAGRPQASQAIPGQVSTPVELPLPAKPSMPAHRAGGNPEEKNRFWSPLVLHMAREANVPMEQLSSLAGTGHGGRVTKSDLLAFLEARREVSGAETPTITASDVAHTPSNDGGEWFALDTVQRKMATHMRASLDTAAHAWSMFEVDLTNAQRALERRREETLAMSGVKLTLNHFVLQAVVHALQRYPLMNARLEQDGWRRLSKIALGVAVASPKGLVVPVVRDAQDMSFVALARHSNDLAQRARNGKLLPDDLFGTTFTVTNYGVFGQDAGLPIINQPNVGILGIGAAKKRPVVFETANGPALGIATTAWLTLGFDHRLVDGQTAASFLKAVKEELETAT